MKWHLGALSVVLVLGLGAPLAAQAQSSRPMTFGTSAVTYVEVSAFEFFPFDSRWSYTFSNTFARYSANCGGLCFAAPLHLPAGARIVYLELDSSDVDSNFSVLGALMKCNKYVSQCTSYPTAGAGPADCLQGGQICSGNAFNGGSTLQGADLTADDVTVDNYNNSYILLAGSYGGSDSTAISGMIVGYVLQVSPSPATATFADVPTSSPQFQFVEALVAAGITAGCGGGNYCPNNSVTRGQMAVFLAKALGLQWQ